MATARSPRARSRRASATAACAASCAAAAAASAAATRSRASAAGVAASAAIASAASARARSEAASASAVASAVSRLAGVAGGGAGWASSEADGACTRAASCHTVGTNDGPRSRLGRGKVRARAAHLPQPADQAGRLLLPGEVEDEHVLPPMLGRVQLEKDGAPLLIDEAQVGHRPRVGLAAQTVRRPVDRVVRHQVALPEHDRPRVLAAPRVLGRIKLRAGQLAAARGAVRRHQGGSKFWRGGKPRTNLKPAPHQRTSLWAKRNSCKPRSSLESEANSRPVCSRRHERARSVRAMTDACSPLATAPVDSTPRLAVLGVISSPANEGRRNWARRFQEGRPDLLLRFVIGAVGLPTLQCRRLLREERAHGGMFLVPASDNAEVGCVDKSFAWLMAAVEAFPATQFIIKTDDDSATHMADLAALLSMRELQSHPHVYAGWAQFASALPATWQQCGWGASAASALRRRQGCAGGAEGPFVFATGALEILSFELARKVFGSG